MALALELLGRGGEHTTSTVARDGNLVYLEALIAAVLENVLHNGKTLLLLHRELGGGRKRVLGEDNGAATAQD